MAPFHPPLRLFGPEFWGAFLLSFSPLLALDPGFVERIQGLRWKGLFISPKHGLERVPSRSTLDHPGTGVDPALYHLVEPIGGPFRRCRLLQDEGKPTKGTPLFLGRIFQGWNPLLISDDRTASPLVPDFSRCDASGRTHRDHGGSLAESPFLTLGRVVAGNPRFFRRDGGINRFGRLCHFSGGLFDGRGGSLSRHGQGLSKMPGGIWAGYL